MERKPLHYFQEANSRCARNKFRLPKLGTWWEQHHAKCICSLTRTNSSIEIQTRSLHFTVSCHQVESLYCWTYQEARLRRPGLGSYQVNFRFDKSIRSQSGSWRFSLYGADCLGEQPNDVGDGWPSSWFSRSLRPCRSLDQSILVRVTSKALLNFRGRAHRGRRATSGGHELHQVNSCAELLCKGRLKL